MITTIFSRSNPFNYLLVIVLLILSFFVYQAQEFTEFLAIVNNVVTLLMLMAALVVSNVIVRREDLTKGSTLPLLFFFSFLLLFPSVFSNIRVVCSGFLVLLGIRRLMMLHASDNPKEKLFDASLWIFFVSFFHFWSILFILLVFVSMIFHGHRDYRNWLLPFLAFFVSVCLFLFVSLLIDVEFLMHWRKYTQVNLNFDYFTDNIQNVALSIYAAFAILFFFAQMVSFSEKPVIMHSAYKKIMLSFVIGVAVFVVSPRKSNDLLIFSFMPSAIMATSYIEGIRVLWFKELMTFLLVGGSILCFFLQL